MNIFRNNISRRDFLGDCGKMSGVASLASVVNLGCLQSVSAQVTNSNAPYRGVVNLVLGGGADSYSFIAPADEDGFAKYTAVRKLAAHGRGSFTEAETLDGEKFLIHNQFREVREMFEAGELSFIQGIGTLVEPLLPENNYAGERPFGLGSHQDQRISWQNSVPNMRGGALGGTGWIGRMMETLEGVNLGSAYNPSICQANPLSQTGFQTSPLSVSSRGPNHLDIYQSDIDVKAVIDYDLEKTYKTVLQNHINQSRKSTIIDMQNLFELAKGVIIRTQFPNTALGNQLKNVAKYIAIREQMGLNRQTFTVNDGGYDMHTNTRGRITGKMAVVSQALKAFRDALQELGVFDQVATYISSDFGRSMGANTSGTNHGWAAVSLVMGGGVKPRQLFGGVPDYNRETSPLFVGTRPTPTIATDELFASIAYWFGVDNDNNMERMLPNIRNFGAAGNPDGNAGVFLDCFSPESIASRKG